MKDKQKNIKSIIAMLLVAAMALACACTNRGNEPAPTELPGADATPVSGIELPDDDFTVPSGDGISFLVTGSSTSIATGAVSSAFKQSYMDLTASLLARCQDGNTFISPLSIITALQMAASGAKGDTLSEMLLLLGGGTQDIAELNRQLANFYAGLSSAADAKFHSANALWLTNNPDFLINTSYLELVKESFAAQIATAPLSARGTIDAINKWCSDNTDGMIPKVIDDLSDDAVAVLLNALCFDALWQSQYSDDETAFKTFNGTDGAKNVKFLCSREYRYFSSGSEQAFVKQYKGGKYSFLGVLPEAGTDIDSYVKDLTGDKLLAIIGGMENAPVNVELPEFSMDCDYRLEKILPELGMTAAFDPDAADFTGLGKMVSGDSPYISGIIHKTHLEVDQSGTRAAAVTAIIMESATAIEDPIPSLILDRPFVFAIMDNTSGLPVFIGSCLNVEQ